MPRREREPPAPTALDDILSAESLASSPWVKARIRELGLVGKKVQSWLPPEFRMRYVGRHDFSHGNWEPVCRESRLYENV